MEVATVGNAKGARIAALLMAAGGFTINEVLNPEFREFREFRELNTPVFQLALEERLKKTARRKLKQALMNLYVAKRREEDGTRRITATSEFKTLWARARKQIK
jgi:hypothetical protein